MLNSPLYKWIALTLAVVLVGSIALFYRQTSKPLDYVEADIESESPTENITFSNPTMIVHIAGAVYRPGVYEVTGNVRVMDILKLAGGPLPQADLDGVNLAAKVKDGQKIKVPELNSSAKKSSQASSSKTEKLNTIETQTNLPVHLSTASQEALMTIPGIGPGMATRIITFRNSGTWSTLEDFKKIKGLGKKKWEKILTV